jgi:hypothetical protein
MKIILKQKLANKPPQTLSNEEQDKLFEEFSRWRNSKKQ